jgi:hypothetical protein
MPWIVGIDEAGYGPNLGPLVMTAVACRVPEGLAAADLWDVLKTAVCQPPSTDRGRILVGDSKLVYSTARGLHDLELGVLSTLAPCRDGVPLDLAGYVEWSCQRSHPELRAEPWYAGTSRLPLCVEAGPFADAAGRFRQTCASQGVVWGLVRGVVVCPARFNGWLDKWGSKGAVLGQALTELLGAVGDLEGDDPLAVVIDKHGGRNRYAAMLQHAFTDGMVVAHQEGMGNSDYSVIGLRRPVRLSFRPRADQGHFCVALASMCSKYLREVLMLEFNQFWKRHLPDLKPTAGYPGDAARFFEAIRPTAARLGIAEPALWRRK